MGLVAERAMLIRMATSGSFNSSERANFQMQLSLVEIPSDKAEMSFWNSSSDWSPFTRSSKKSHPSCLTQSKKTNTLGNPSCAAATFSSPPVSLHETAVLFLQAFSPYCIRLQSSIHITEENCNFSHKHLCIHYSTYSR